MFQTLLKQPLNVPISGTAELVQLTFPPEYLNVRLSMKTGGQFTVKVKWFSDSARTAQVDEETGHDGPAVGGFIAFNTNTKSPYATVEVTNKDAAAAATIDQAAVLY